MTSVSTPYLLYADDDKEDQEIFSDILCRSDLSVQPYIFDNGLPLIQFLENIDIENNFPRIIVLDINMPVWDGIHTLHILRQINKYKSIPIIMYSTSSSLNDKKRCLELGSTDFITKPTLEKDFDETAALLSKYLQ